MERNKSKLLKIFLYIDSIKLETVPKIQKEIEIWKDNHEESSRIPESVGSDQGDDHSEFGSPSCYVSVQELDNEKSWQAIN